MDILLHYNTSHKNMAKGRITAGQPVEGKILL